MIGISHVFGNPINYPWFLSGPTRFLAKVFQTQTECVWIFSFRNNSFYLFVLLNHYRVWKYPAYKVSISIENAHLTLCTYSDSKRFFRNKSLAKLALYFIFILNEINWKFQFQNYHKQFIPVSYLCIYFAKSIIILKRHHTHSHD